MRTVYLDSKEEAPPPPPYRTGKAGHVFVAEDGTLETDLRVELSANSTHALLGHGVVDELNRLPLDGRLGEGRRGRIHNREYQVTLARLTYLMSTASREGHAAWIRI